MALRTSKTPFLGILLVSALALSAVNGPVTVEAGGALLPQASSTTGGPLPKHSGTVAITGASKGSTVDKQTTTKTKAVVAAAATTSKKKALRALVVAVDASDFGLPTWTTMLDRVGAQYDVLYAKDTPLTDASLVNASGVGKYNAILLTNAMLLMDDGAGNFVSGFDADEWNRLWTYERTFAVRQAVLYASYGTWPEDYCLTGSSEGTVLDTPLMATLTSAGKGALSYLKSGAQIPIRQSYVYRNRIKAGCSAQAVLTAGSDVLGVLSTSTDGRERMALTFTSNQNVLHSQLLTFGLFRWASRGLYLGEQRYYLKVDADDWFNSSDVLQPDGSVQSSPGYSMSGNEAYNVSTQQKNLRSKHPNAKAFTFGLAFNGADADSRPSTLCLLVINPSLSNASYCLRSEFEWINHTYTHPKMNTTGYQTNVDEINKNLSRASTYKLTVDKKVLKTPEYSGLGVYNPNATNDIDPPTDFGIMASNPNLLSAAVATGVKYLHGNMSFASHQPSCFNCAIQHPMEPRLYVVPDWPTNLAYYSTNPAQETQFYNMFYGPGGKFPFWDHPLTYNEIVAYDSDQVLQRVATGTAYTNTVHIANLHNYGSGKTLATDWLDAVMTKYDQYFSVPLLCPKWGALGDYTVDRTNHFAAKNNVTAVYDGATNTVSFSAPSASTVFVSGIKPSGAQQYGDSWIAKLRLAAGKTQSFTPSLLP